MSIQKSRIREISTHRQGRIAWRVAGGALVTLLMVFAVTKGQQASPPAAETNTAEEVAPAAEVNGAGKKLIQKKLDSIIIPRIDFEDVSVEDAIAFLRQRSAELDEAENDPSKKGFNFVIVINPLAADPTPLIRELRLRNVPLGTVLKYICDQTKLRYTVDDSAVILSRMDEVVAQPAAAPVGEKATAIQKKLDSIIIPRIDFEDVSVEDAIAFLRSRSAELDVVENDPAQKGINFVIKPLAADAAPKIRELRHRNVPLGTVIKYICDQTNLRYTVEAHAVILSPKNETGVDPVIPKNQ